MTLFLELKEFVYHEILIEKVMKYGVKGKEVEWFTSCLSSRK